MPMRKPPAPENPGDPLFQAYRWLKNYGHLPVLGGMQAQPAKFIAAVDLIEAVNVAYLRRKQKSEEDKYKAQSWFEKVHGAGS